MQTHFPSILTKHVTTNHDHSHASRANDEEFNKQFSMVNDFEFYSVCSSGI